MASSPGERILAAEWMTVVVVQAGNAFDSGGWPAPSQFIAAMIVYMMLAGASLAGKGPAKLAASMGGLVGLYMLVVPPKGKSQSVLEGFFSWLANLQSSGIRDPQDSSASKPKVAPAKTGGVVGAVEGAVTHIPGDLVSPTGLSQLTQGALPGISNVPTINGISLPIPPIPGPTKTVHLGPITITF